MKKAVIAHVGNVDNTSLDAFETVFSVNVKGVFLCLKAGVEKMKSKGGFITLNT
jgi:NAD(P)-dependent dehydrogenase (short-subunit alcohol dehydrogenase family)